MLKCKNLKSTDTVRAWFGCFLILPPLRLRCTEVEVASFKLLRWITCLGGFKHHFSRVMSSGWKVIVATPSVEGNESCFSLFIKETNNIFCSTTIEHNELNFFLGRDVETRDQLPSPSRNISVLSVHHYLVHYITMHLAYPILCM